MKSIYRSKSVRGVVVIVLVIGGLLIFLNKATPPNPQEGNEISQLETEEELSLIIDDGDGTPKTFKIKFREGMTIFDLLEEKTRELGLVLKTKTYEIGIFIEAIGEKENGENEKYWMYYVNGVLPMVAADRQEINPGDRIEFKFEKPSF